jgi:hypothetical protein
MIRQVKGIGATGLLLVAVLYHPGIVAAHGGADIEEDPCMRLAGESMVHFSAYQPQYGPKDQYCTEIPQEGETFLVVDLVDPALRKGTVGMRVMRGNGRNEAEDEIVADVRPSTHPDGVLRSKVNLEEGLYRVIIASEKQNLLRRPQYVLRVHMVDYQKLVLSFAGPLIALLFTGWLAYKLIRSKWMQKWLAAPSS